MGLDPNLKFRPLTAQFKQDTRGNYIVDHLTASCEVSATCVSAVCVSAISATVSGLKLKDLYTHEGKRIDFEAIDSCSLNIVALDIDGGTDIGAALVDADLLIVDDGAGGTNRKSAVSRMKTYVLDGSGKVPLSKLDMTGSGNVPLAKLDMTGSGNVPLSKLDMTGSGVLPLSKVDMTTSGKVPLAKLDLGTVLTANKEFVDGNFQTHTVAVSNGLIVTWDIN